MHAPITLTKCYKVGFKTFSFETESPMRRVKGLQSIPVTVYEPSRDIMHRDKCHNEEISSRTRLIETDCFQTSGYCSFRVVRFVDDKITRKGPGPMDAKEFQQICDEKSV